MDDLTIIGLYIARDEKAIRETADKYGRLCFSVANNILGDDSDAEECVNDTYLSVWNTIPPTRPHNLQAFICRITRNLSLKRLDHNKAGKRTPDAVVPLSELEEILSDESIPPPEVGTDEISRLISDFLRQEKEEARNVFIRRYWFFDPVSDIARRYAFTESRVKNMLYHTRNRLREYLRKEGIEI